MSELKPIEVQGMSLDNMQTYTEQLRAKYVRKKDLPTNVSAFDNDAKYQTEEQVDAKINAKVASAYKAGGSVSFAALPELAEANMGLVFNLTDKFITTADFVEGEGKEHPAGTNVAIVKAGESYKYDVMAGFVDLSGYAETEAVAADIGAAKAEAVNEANAATDGKLAGYIKSSDIREITAEEIAALFAED